MAMGNGECISLPLFSYQLPCSTIIILDSHFVNRVHSKDEMAIHGLLKDLGIEQGSKHFKNPKVIQPKVHSNFLLRGGYTFSLFF